MTPEAESDIQIARAGAALAFPGMLTATSLVLPENLPYEKWLSIGDTLKRMEKSVQWWIGDWLRFGERKYGEMYSQALNESDYAYGTLANIKYVADRIESSLRSENVPWSHHKEIAPVAQIAPEAARQLLEQIEANHLSVTQVRAEVKELKQQLGEQRYEDLSRGDGMDYEKVARLVCWQRPDDSISRMHLMGDEKDGYGYPLTFCNALTRPTLSGDIAELYLYNDADRVGREYHIKTCVECYGKQSQLQWPDYKAYQKVLDDQDRAWQIQPIEDNKINPHIPPRVKPRKVYNAGNREIADAIDITEGGTR